MKDLTIFAHNISLTMLFSNKKKELIIFKAYSGSQKDQKRWKN